MSDHSTGSEPPRPRPQLTRLLLRALIFAAIGFLVWLLLGRLVDGKVFDNPFVGVVVGLFAGAISMISSRRR